MKEKEIYIYKKKYNIMKVNELHKCKIFNFVRQCVDESTPQKMVEMLDYHLEKNRSKYYLTQRRPVNTLIDSLPYLKIPLAWNKERFTELYASTSAFTNVRCCGTREWRRTKDAEMRDKNTGLELDQD